MKKILTSNMEDYLEAIVILKKRRGVVRVKEIGNLLNVKTPSVSSAIRILSKNGLVYHRRYGDVEITSKGERLAKVIQNRHKLLIKFLADILGVNPRVANLDACKIEHNLSSESFRKLNRFIKKIEYSYNREKYSGTKSFCLR